MLMELVVTYDGPNRKHIWTFAAISTSSRTARCYVDKPGFVGDNYACMTLITNNRCPSNTNCSPMFSRHLVPPTSADIEMRVCLDQSSDDENILLDNVDIICPMTVYTRQFHKCSIETSNRQ